MKKEKRSAWGLILFFCLTPLYLLSPEKTGFWWKMDIKIKVSGEYQYPLNKETLKGVYDFSVQFSALSDKDIDEDLILYPGEMVVDSVKWEEMYALKEVDKVDLSSRVKILGNLYYIFERNGKIYYDFNIYAQFNPPSFSGVAESICLPQSHENEVNRQLKNYNRYVTSGSNEVFVTDKEINQNEKTEKKFTWVWHRQDLSGWQRHRVEADVFVFRLGQGNDPIF